MSADIEMQANAPQSAVTAPHVIDLESGTSEFVDGDDRLVQLTPGRPADSETQAATEIVEMRSDKPREDDFRTAA